MRSLQIRNVPDDVHRILKARRRCSWIVPVSPEEPAPPIAVGGRASGTL